MNILCARIDQSVTEEIRARSSGNRGAVDTTVVDAGPVGHDLLHRKRRIFHRRRSHRGAHTSSRSYGAGSLSAGRSVARRDRGQPEKGIQMDSQLQNTVGQNRVFR